MQKTLLRKTIIEILYNKGNLLLVAAWLYTISFVISNYWAINSTPANVQLKMETQLKERENLFNGLLQDKAFVQQILDNSIRPDETILFRKWPIGIFSYIVDSNNQYIPVYWNTSSMSISPKDYQLEQGHYTVKYPNGIFELIKKEIYRDNKHFAIFAQIPIYWEYFDDNKFLYSHFDGFDKLANNYTISDRGYPIRNGLGETIYHIAQKNSNASISIGNDIPLYINIVAMILFSIFLMGMVIIISDAYGTRIGVLFFIALIIVTRIFLTFNIFPFNLHNNLLFDPSIYASSSINPSLGDLFVNTYLLLWFISFIKYKYRPWAIATLRNIVTRYPYLSAIISCIIWLSFTFISIYILRSLVSDSQIPFDVNNIFSLNIYTFVALLIAGFIAIIFYNMGYLFYTPFKIADIPTIHQLVIIFLCGLLLISVFVSKEDIQLYCITVLWFCLIIILLQYNQKELPKAIYNQPAFLFWLTIFSLSIAGLLLNDNLKKTYIQEKSIAQKIYYQLQNNDNTMLKNSIVRLQASLDSTDTRLFDQPILNKKLKDSLLNTCFPEYFNNYNTDILTFDTSRHALFNDNFLNYSNIEALIQNYATSTDVNNLFYLGNSNKDYSYIYRLPITRKGTYKGRIGYLFLIVKQKNTFTNSPYFEIFPDNNKQGQYQPDTKYAFAIYNKNALINSWNKYAFTDRISPSVTNKSFYPQFEVIKNSPNAELWYFPEKNKTIIVANNKKLAVEFMSLFSYIFISTLIFILYIFIISFIQQTGLRRNVFKGNLRLTLTSRIQITINAISLFSFIVIGISVISYFINNFNQSNQEKLSLVMHTFGREVESALSNINNYDEMIKQTSHNGVMANTKVKKDIFSIAYANNIDLQIYDTIGELKLSTQTFLYDKGILSKQMDPLAYYNLKTKHRIEYLQTEKIGKYSFLSIYQPIYYQDGRILGFLNIPYLNSQKDVQDEIASIILTIVNLMVVIFILSAAFSLQLTQRITKSFDVIIQKMRYINIGKQNEEIVWDQKDEIGLLVSEYNVMVRKLYKSAINLAKTEREGAWQEMARQVAHEIKNPLTPMKLSIQYLQKSINADASNIKELSGRVTTTLVEQIDQLAAIASDFSQLANINQSRMEDVNINDTLSKLVTMYSSDSSNAISIVTNATKAIIIADKIQMNRLFTNLIKNAIEASQENELKKIDIVTENDANNIIVYIKDYGTGIEPNKIEQIFTPNFTTKSSGTGLGLAICRGICLKSNGYITVESKLGVGSTFVVKFPLKESFFEKNI